MVAIKKKLTKASPKKDTTLAEVFKPKLNVKQLATRRNKAKEGNLKLCKELWPHVKDSELWLQEDRSKKGFVWMPRPMPLFIDLINDASKRFGKKVPAGKSYLALWCRVRDGAFLDIENEAVAALDAGYGGERNVGTWRAHLRVLKDLGFIDYKAGPSGPFQFILLWNPYHVVKKLKAKNWVQEAPYIAIRKRALEIGATDMDDE
jgi:hypothetical protein